MPLVAWVGKRERGAQGGEWGWVGTGREPLCAEASELLKDVGV